MEQELIQKDIEELEALYDQAVQKGDQTLADVIAYLIVEKQDKIVNKNS